MKKRYLSMLMAVVLCLSLFTTGALAASGEVEAAAPAESVEPVMDGQPSETPVENAEPGETPQTQALDGENAGLPQPMALSSDGEGNANPSTLNPVPTYGTTIEGYAIAGYGGTVTYGTLGATSAPSSNQVPNFSFENYFTWEKEEPNTMSQYATVSGERDSLGTPPKYRINNVKISVKTAAPAKTYEFSINKDNGMGLTCYTGTLAVLTLAAARAQTDPTIVTYEGFQLYKYTGTETSPTPLAGAVFGLYTSDPNDPAADAAPSPVATFTTEANGLAEIKLDGTTAENALPKLGDPTKSGAEKGGTNYFLKEITAPDGYARSDTVWSVFGYAEWVTETNGATTSLKFVLDHPTSGWNATESRFEVSNQPLPNDYAGFDLVAWAETNVTWDETAGDYRWDVDKLPGVAFTVYADEACETPIHTFTTGPDGTVTIDPEQFAEKLPAPGDEPKTFYLKQTGAQDTAHGRRPVATVRWSFTASAARIESSDIYALISLSMPTSVDDGNGVGCVKDREFWVENERYVSLSFDLVKQVVKTDKNASLGENRFDFAIVVKSYNDVHPELVFTPEGGSSVVLSDHSMAAIDGKDERVYPVSLAVDGEGTAKASVTMQGWESAMRPLEVYETGDAPQDWEYADCMYMLQPGETKLIIQRVPESTDGSYTGYDGKIYDKQFSELKDAVEFTNSYTKPAPVPTATPAPTPVPTATPEPAKAVKTGDEANVALWLALATVSALGLGYVSLRKKEN